MLVTVEGLIGQGKTTLCERLDMEHLYEPVDSNPFLSLYYEDPSRWAFAMQCNLLCERFAMFQKAQWLSQSGTDVCIDRSFYGDYAFALVQYQDGYMTEQEFQSYRKMHILHQRYLMFPDLILRLNCSISTTMARINNRARGCESGIQQSYIEHLDAAYDKLFSELNRMCKVVTIDAEQDADGVLSDARFAIEQRRIELEAASWEYPHYKGV